MVGAAHTVTTTDAGADEHLSCILDMRMRTSGMIRRLSFGTTNDLASFFLLPCIVAMARSADFLVCCTNCTCMLHLLGHHEKSRNVSSKRLPEGFCRLTRLHTVSLIASTGTISTRTSISTAIRRCLVLRLSWIDMACGNIHNGSAVLPERLCRVACSTRLRRVLIGLKGGQSRMRGTIEEVLRLTRI